MEVLHVFKKIKNNLTNYLYFMIKILFNFKCIYAFARSYMLVSYKMDITISSLYLLWITASNTRKTHFYT